MSLWGTLNCVCLPFQGRTATKPSSQCTQGLRGMFWEQWQIISRDWKNPCWHFIYMKSLSTFSVSASHHGAASNMCPRLQVNICFSLRLSAGLLQEQDVATEALQLSCLLLPPPNRRRLQLLLRLMAKVCQNPHLPPFNDTIATRTLVQIHAWF